MHVATTLSVPNTTRTMASHEIFIGDNVSQMIDEGKLIIWDVFSGGGSLQDNIKELGFEDEFVIVEIDIDHQSKNGPNVVKIYGDITRLTEVEINFWYKKYPCVAHWGSPDCSENTPLKNGKSRDMKKTRKLLNGESLIVDVLSSINLSILYAIENPTSKIFKTYCNVNNYSYIETSYCKFSELKEKNGFYYQTFPYRKHTMIATNIENLKLPKCRFDCNSLKNGVHLARIGYRPTNPSQITSRDCLKNLKNHGIYPPKYSAQKYHYRVPKLLHFEIIKHVIGMYIFCALFFMASMITQH